MEKHLEKFTWLRENPVCDNCSELITFLTRVPHHYTTGVRAIGYCQKCGRLIIQKEKIIKGEKYDK